MTRIIFLYLVDKRVNPLMFKTHLPPLLTKILSLKILFIFVNLYSLILLLRLISA